MAFVKNDIKYEVRMFRTFVEAQQIFEDLSEDESMRLDALNYILNHQEISYVLDILLNNYGENSNTDHPLIDHAFANFHIKPKRDDDYEVILNILKSSNAYLRNKAITFLQDYGESAKAFIQKLLDCDDRDLKIFAVNILGDVKYEDSRDMLINLIKKEKDVNVLMTAIDYLGEIGELEDVELLETLTDKFSDEPYVAFGIKLAVEKIKG